MFVATACIGKNSQEGTCFKAAAWKTKSEPLITFSTLLKSLVSPIKNLTLESFSSFLRISCLFSSLLKIRISEISLLIRCLTMVDPKEPVPPVIVTTEDFDNLDIGLTFGRHQAD